MFVYTIHVDKLLFDDYTVVAVFVYIIHVDTLLFDDYSVVTVFVYVFHVNTLLLQLLSIYLFLIFMQSFLVHASLYHYNRQWAFRWAIVMNVHI